MAGSTSKSDRAQRAAAMQRKARSADRKRSALIWGSAAAVVVLIFALVWYAVASRPSLGAVQTFDDVGSEHVAEAVEYPQDPPAGGDHNQAWWNCGIYEEPVPAYHAVHSLEHGAVWLTYQPDLPQKQIDELTDLANQEFMLLSPGENQDSPVVATAWGVQLEVDTADDERLPLFITEYRQGPQTPEPGATCTGGTSVDLLPTR